MRGAPDQRFLFLRGLRQILRIPSPDASLETESTVAAFISDDPERPPRRPDRPRTTAGSGIGLTHDQDEPPALPPSLQAHGQALQRALQGSSSELEKAVQDFISASFDSPQHSAAASRFLLHYFFARLPVLARVVTPENLLAELQHGGSLLTQVIALRWDQTGENERLHQLAQACIDHASTLESHQAVEFTAALAAAIAFRKPTLARSLIAHAKPRLHEDSDERLIPDAEQCLDAGLVLEHLDSSTRETWCHRLRFADRNWNWETRESQRILDVLAEHLLPDAHCAPLFEQIIPGAQWQGLFRNVVPSASSEPATASISTATLTTAEPAAAEPVIVAEEPTSTTEVRKPAASESHAPAKANEPPAPEATPPLVKAQVPEPEKPAEKPTATEAPAKVADSKPTISEVAAKAEPASETTIAKPSETPAPTPEKSAEKAEATAPAAAAAKAADSKPSAPRPRSRLLTFVTGMSCGLLAALGVWSSVRENQQTLLKMVQGTPLQSLLAQANIGQPTSLAPATTKPPTIASTPAARSRVSPPPPPKPAPTPQPKIEPKPEPKPRPAPTPEFVGPPLSIASLIANVPFIGPPFPAPTPPVVETPAPVVSKPVVLTEFERWKQGRIDQILRDFPALEAWHTNAHSSSWKDASIVIAGRHPAAPAKSSAHRAFLTLLVLDPPRDRDVLRASHIAFARNLSAKECLDVWEPLIAQEVSNSPEIRNAASIMAELMAPQLSGDTRQRLERIVATP